MRKSILLMVCLSGLAGLATWAVPARAQSGPASPPLQADTARPTHPAVVVDPRWQASLDAFAAADELRAPKPGGVVFVGSSSIRLWDGLETQFSQLPVIVKRGFGGSRMLDCTQYLERLVLPYKPRLVVVYAGDNDLAEGRSPEDVLASFRGFVEGVQRQLPQTRIAYLSIKPSPLREALLPKMRATNALIERYSQSRPLLDFIDIYTPMLQADGRPRPELFAADALHLNEAGYALWQEVIASHLRLAETGAAAAAATTAP
ncbi:MAG: GDSL family lipase [Methylibium sp.]|uniref:SGNH/GDSL hydrolase family protein n=1 Tax=Methylibium sp. TaxID=2067992 RepID=UPI0017C2FB76|nr:SGNH/GDSL hydrolase family protein [Methylibium sp.]MBA3598306.1 GDSL family lipase [Methylibium sp.]